MRDLEGIVSSFDGLVFDLFDDGGGDELGFTSEGVVFIHSFYFIIMMDIYQMRI